MLGDQTLADLGLQVFLDALIILTLCPRCPSAVFACIAPTLLTTV